MFECEKCGQTDCDCDNPVGKVFMDTTGQGWRIGKRIDDEVQQESRRRINSAIQCSKRKTFMSNMQSTLRLEYLYCQIGKLVYESSSQMDITVCVGEDFMTTDEVFRVCTNCHQHDICMMKKEISQILKENVDNV